MTNSTKNVPERQTTIFGETIDDTTEMMVSLDIKKPSEFFWLRKIRDVDIRKCCAECFIGDKDSRLYYSTYSRQTPTKVELDVKPHTKYVAYYICGLSWKFNYDNNTHVAFVYAPGETLRVETPQINLSVSNAAEIEFKDYIPNPEGNYTDYQRRCRNWIFANYIRDGMVKKV